MRVYIAAQFERKAEVREKADELRAHGFEITSSWLEEPAEEGMGADLGYTPERLAACALQDVADVAASDVFVSLIDRSGGRGGRHIEFGLAYAWQKRLLLVGPRPENVFHHLPGVRRVDTWLEAIGELRRFRQQESR